MREIKFRGKRKDNGEWVEGNYTHNFRKGECHYISNFDDNIDHEVDPETVSQFITKNNAGQDIYECSILQGKFATGLGGTSTKYKEMNFRVEFNEYSQRYDPDMPKNYGKYRFIPHIKDCLVVGNIHDDPELLNQ